MATAREEMAGETETDRVTAAMVALLEKKHKGVKAPVDVIDKWTLLALEQYFESQAYLNSMLEIRQVVGSAYHPQSQGIVERMHRTMKMIMKGLVDDYPETWVNQLPYAQFVLRTLPLRSLGGRSPYEVVTGLRMKMPSSMIARYPVQDLTVDEYVDDLLQSMRGVYARVKRRMDDAVAQVKFALGLECVLLLGAHIEGIGGGVKLG